MNSKGTLYIDCPEQVKDNAFSVNKELSEDEYVKMLREYSYTISGLSKEKKIDNRYNIYDLNNEQNENSINYSKSSVKLYNISGNPCDIKELYNIEKRGVGVLIIEIIESEMEENFEYEFKFWKKDGMNINNDSNIDKDERIRFLPVKDLKFEIDNHVFMFYGCKIYCEYDSLKVALIIQNIKEI